MLGTTLFGNGLLKDSIPKHNIRKYQIHGLLVCQKVHKDTGVAVQGPLPYLIVLVYACVAYGTLHCKVSNYLVNVAYPAFPGGMKPNVFMPKFNL